MIELRPFDQLGTFRNEWLDAHYHFSFADYLNRDRMGLGVLRVWNDDTIRPHTGFPPHGHRDMEIITYVRKGAITHEDGLGNRGRTAAGDVQVMSAGGGITHAEFNLEDEETQLFQIWIQTDQRGHQPRWETRAFPGRDRAGRLTPLASGRPGDDGALAIHQDAAVLGATLFPGQSVSHRLAGRRAYLVPSAGTILVNDVRARARDGIVAAGEDVLTIAAADDTAEVVLVDVP